MLASFAWPYAEYLSDGIEKRTQHEEPNKDLILGISSTDHILQA